ncbi:MAG: hypothetical protein A2946_02675 [Candidatus Liptonbacteria bacterium RIFCSPLOWO2_01_FULL_53_13]|uniref:Uncharacterized protein n=1 Tax=Candidatus Liptonbacteria bacterium RIFCSPLOWO2_01_FULL_53_13 TaxID=1798651 RepID=A0A1G2CKY6_9BACT|nr:MAG: hypothetical protein A2946_02675 [Candidatus Liptonbacteria bacterium RIFCSPLOWO2_01_FULL_53_13]
MSTTPTQAYGEDALIRQLLASWAVTQSKFSAKAGESGTYGSPGQLQFIAKDTLLVYYDDGLVDHTSVLRYKDGAFTELKHVGIMNTMPLNQWEALVKTYGDQNFPASSYTTYVVRDGKFIDYKELTKVPENVFVKEGTIGWKTYTNTQYGFEFRYPINWKAAQHDTPESLAFLGEGGGIGINVLKRKFDSSNVTGVYGKIEKPLLVKIGVQDGYEYGEADAGCRNRSIQTGLTDVTLRVFFSSCEGDANPILDNPTLMNQILSTFKFISPSQSSVIYRNDQYKFEIPLPASWKGYAVQTKTWQAHIPTGFGEQVVATGPELHVVHPLSTPQNPRQDIPIMVFTHDQWTKIGAGGSKTGTMEWSVGTAPIPPSELGRNAFYVFALPARYNYAFATGYEEVEQILSTFKFTAATESSTLSQSVATALAKSAWGDCYPGRCTQFSVTTDSTNGVWYVTALYKGLYDDSTAAERKVAVATYQNGQWMLGQPTVTWSCAMGRGHQDFSTASCE